jgi:hypothetical protein
VTRALVAEGALVVAGARTTKSLQALDRVIDGGLIKTL